MSLSGPRVKLLSDLSFLVCYRTVSQLKTNRLHKKYQLEAVPDLRSASEGCSRKHRYHYLNH
ncbi:hypothetical protein AG1IA_04048 [Rhizoctonia solani AG-1 IA]|uniref:Uncharacterized protein n=1 Tax=Thanatephorus cucumeris (strain AG1-IA) TaxID=983506 RepID=L8WYT2_THACA|nr:hypothetical protein AG1IA_04048 [Rhizoctonia solani AG-1 IA]